MLCGEGTKAADKRPKESIYYAVWRRHPRLQKRGLNKAYIMLCGEGTQAADERPE
jgi:hypothetical protein